ncbi:hypothetical protein HAX54_005344, partial [Datura stramonium]|nr:hypothetical protein [Datura stramonium]
ADPPRCSGRCYNRSNDYSSGPLQWDFDHHNGLTAAEIPPLQWSSVINFSQSYSPTLKFSLSPSVTPLCPSPRPVRVF